MRGQPLVEVIDFVALPAWPLLHKRARLSNGEGLIGCHIEIARQHAGEGCVGIGHEPNGDALDLGGTENVAGES